MTAIVDQPSPIATGRRPTWEIVMSFVEQNCSSNVASLVLPDMRDRDVLGRQRYGTPLTSGNGRDHLVDAYQEMLDSCVYLANELDEYGVGPASKLDEEKRLSSQLRSRLCRVQQLFVGHVRGLIELRQLIEERVS